MQSGDCEVQIDEAPLDAHLRRTLVQHPCQVVEVPANPLRDGSVLIKVLFVLVHPRQVRRLDVCGPLLNLKPRHQRSEVMPSEAAAWNLGQRKHWMVLAKVDYEVTHVALERVSTLRRTQRLAILE